MMVLALDLGTTTGWAIGEDGTPRYGTWNLKPQRGESPGMRYVRLKRELQLMKDAYPDIQLLAYEQPHMRGGHATEVLAGCVAIVQEWCAERGVEHSAVHTGTLKKWATGSGNAGKEDMIVAAHLKLEYFQGDGLNMTHDEADAILLHGYAMEELVG